MGWVRRAWPGAAVGLAIMTALAGGNLGVRGGPPLPPSPPRPLSFLHVGAASGPSGLRQVVDENGREVLLKGVNVDGITDYFHGGNHPLSEKLQNPYSFDPADYTGGGCVADVKDVEGVPLCSLDFQQLHPLGYNVIRLTLSWSLIEPTIGGGVDLPNTPSHMYLDRIAQVVAWARAEGIYVLLDLHQDTWSKYDYTTAAERPMCVAPLQPIDGADGAPPWASRQHPAIPNCAPNGIAQLSPAVEDDFRALYDDADGIPPPVPVFSHFENIFLALAKRFHDEPAVAGYEMFNEPLPGYMPTAGVFDQTELFPMYGKIIKNVTDNVAGFHQLFFVEPNALRNSIDQSANFLPWSTFSSYPNVVYTPHIYTGVFTLDAMGGHRGIFPSNGGYNSSIADAGHLGLPLFVSEFGNSPQDDDTILRGHYQLQDADQVGGRCGSGRRTSVGSGACTPGASMAAIPTVHPGRAGSSSRIAPTRCSRPGTFRRSITSQTPPPSTCMPPRHRCSAASSRAARCCSSRRRRPAPSRLRTRTSSSSIAATAVVRSTRIRLAATTGCSAAMRLPARDRHRQGATSP